MAAGWEPGPRRGKMKKLIHELGLAGLLIAIAALVLAGGEAGAGSGGEVKRPVQVASGDYPRPVQDMDSVWPAVDPNSYPALSDEELGHLRWVLAIADQPLGDFKNLEGTDQFGMTSYRYAIAFSAYFLALEQYHKLPACPELIQPRMDRLIQKMISKPVWEYWAGESRGIPTLEPKFNAPYPENPDPVSNMNIMYSGHVGHMIGLYETLYHDFKWDQPGAITFVYSPTEKFVYDHHSLNQVMRDQMQKNSYHAICCEPNAVFPECNQHPILSFMLHDAVHGTDLAKVSELFMDFFLKKEMINPRTHETAILYLVKQDLTVAQATPRYHNPMDLIIAPAVSLGIVSLESSSANGWTGAFMHAWQPDYIARQYPYQLKNHLVESAKEGPGLNSDYWEPNLKYGFFTLYAGEMGDLATRDRLVAAADREYSPVWENGAFHYPYNLSRKCTNLTDKLLAMAKANPKDGLWTLHNRPFDAAHFVEPSLAGADFMKLGLRRAVYDRPKRVLVFTTDPLIKSRDSVVVQIINLDPQLDYRLFRDWQEQKTIPGQGSLSISIPLDARHDYILFSFP